MLAVAAVRVCYSDAVSKRGRLGGRTRAIAGFVLVSIAIALLWNTCGQWRAERSFLDPFAAGTWIVFPWAPRASNHVVLPLVTEFRQRFAIEDVPERAQLDLRALGTAEIHINGQRYSPPEITQRHRNPKHATERIQLDIASRLVVGENVLTFRVERSRGPAAIAFSLRGPGLEVESGESAEVSLAGSAHVAARAANLRPVIDPRLLDERARHTPDALRANAIPLFVMALGSAALAALLLRNRDAAPAALRIGFLLVAGAWVALFFHNHDSLPRDVGFDAAHHWDYVTYVAERGSLPLATEGYQMYQPPLYYALSATALTAFGIDPGLAQADFAMRIVSVVLGILQVGLVFAFARAFVPQSMSGSTATLLFAGFLPAQLYLFQFVTNESMAAVVSALALLLTVRMCGEAAPPLRAYLALGCALGIALLTKVSTLVLLPTCFIALALHEWNARSRALPAIALRLGVCLVAIAAVSGWHYLRVYRAFGDPFVGNWDAISGFGVWQDPGYRVLGDYFRFGGALLEPFYASFRSIPDGIYSTLFGDGLGGGATNLRAGAPWRYGPMSAHYLLSIGPLCGVAIGGWVAVRRLFREITSHGALLVVLPALLALGLVYITLVAPTYGAVKAFYLLPAMACFTALFALGYAAVERRSRLRAIALAWMLLWAANGFYSFWVDVDSPETLFRAGARQYAQREIETAASFYRNALEIDPNRHLIRAELCRVYYELGEIEQAKRECAYVLERDADQVEALLVDGAAHFSQGQLDAADAAFARVAALVPRDERGLLGLVLVATKRGDSRALTERIREHLRVNPWVPDERVLLVEHLIRLGDQAQATEQLQYLRHMAPRDPRVDRLREQLARAFSYPRPAEAEATGP